jgi:hypothetical protein
MTDKFGMSGKPSPSKCPDCNSKLGPIKHGVQYNSRYQTISPGVIKYRHDIYRECECGCLIVWSFPNVWKRRHILPIMDDKLVIAKDY